MGYVDENVEEKGGGGRKVERDREGEGRKKVGS